MFKHQSKQKEGNKQSAFTFKYLWKELDGTNLIKNAKYNIIQCRQNF